MSTPTAPPSAARVPFIRWAVVAISLALLAWSLVGLIANPDFATGDQATAEQVLFVDFNGWHALSGIALAAPGLLAGRWATWSLFFAVAAAAALAATGVWALLDTSPAGVVAFLNNEADALLHFAFAVLYGSAAALHLRARCS
jgi:Domain of unknown function (DUF4383)